MSPAPTRPLFIVTLPARDVGSARKGARAAAEQGADVAELRFDRWSDRSRAACAGLFPTPIPLAATLRSRAEGGEGPDLPAERSAWRREVADLPFAWHDLEIDRDTLDAREFGPAVRVIWSKHLPHAPSIAALEAVLRRPTRPGDLTKVVFPASVLAAVRDVVPFLRSSKVGDPRCVMSTGPSGPLLRALATELGSSAVYCAPPSRSIGPAVEPSQIPVDRLRPWQEARPGARWFAVAGSPVAHSLSPRLHHFWMRSQGRTGLYLALDVPSGGELSEVLRPLRSAGLGGLSITHPLKDEAMAIADRHTEAVDAAGCANTLWFDGDAIWADNTDLAAIRRRLGELKREDPSALDRVCVVGSGGAARASLAACRELGVRPWILARRANAAEAAARRFEARVSPSEGTEPATTVVHATTFGRAIPAELEVNLSPWLGSGTRLIDFVYAPALPTLQSLALERGASYEDGRRLLVYAAAGSYADWWGEAPSEPAIQAALDEVA